MSEGTCIYCGHGIPTSVDPYVEHAVRHMRTHGEFDARVLPRRTRQVRWTPEAVIRAIKMWARDTGHAPTANEWAKADPQHPTSTTCARIFGSWADAIAAAGFPKPSRARRLQSA